jgi:16S rRNA (guanine527-N7)-methyltransferase
LDGGFAILEIAVARLEEGCAAIGLMLSNEQLARFEAFAALLAEANAVLDLTAVTDPLEGVDRHFLDSLTALRYAELLPPGARIIDVGSGAGFPGVPLAITRPDLEVTLLDAGGKRVDFLRRALPALKLCVEVIHARAEDAARFPKHRERYDVAVSRAVTALPVLLEFTLPFVRVGGHALAWKGPAVFGELTDGRRAAELLGGFLLPALAAPVPGRNWRHVLIVAEKTRETVQRYPRRAGMPKRKPLVSSARAL